MTESSSGFFGTGFFDWQRAGAEHLRRMYERTGYNEAEYWGGFATEPVDEATYQLPSWAIGPFRKYPGNPVFGPAEKGWDRGRFGGGVHNGAIVRKDGLFYYIYRGEEPLPEGFWGQAEHQFTTFGEIDYICDIGIATSPDGVTFTRFDEHSPLFRHGEDARYSFEDVCVVEHAGEYYLFCNRWDWTDPENPAINGVYVAVSDDLLNWRKVGLAFPGATEIHRNACVLQNPENQAVRVDGRFVMYLNNGLIAYSDDLLRWESTKIDELWPGGEGCFALTDYSASDPDRIVLFTGGHHTGHFYAIGQVLLSKSDPTRALDWLPRPVLVAEERYPWENCRDAEEPERLVSCFRDCIFFTGMTRHEGTWWMYYGGSEVYTCLAQADVQTT